MINRRNFVRSSLAAAVACGLPTQRLYALDQAASQAAGGLAAVKLDGSAIHSFLENDRPEIRWAYDEASCDAYLIKHLTGDLYSWWIWSEIQDAEEFKRLIEAHEELRGQPLNEQRANDMYTTATNRPP